MKKSTLFIVTFILFIFTVKSFAQVDISGTPYTTLKGAFDAINAGTHTGAITININASTTETASAVLNSGIVAPASYTSVLIKPTANGLTISGSVPGGALIKLNGADFVTIDGRVGAVDTRQLTINNTGTTTLSTGIWMSSLGVGLGATNNTVKWCNVMGTLQLPTLSIYGIYVGGLTISTTGTGADNDTTTITNNKFTRLSHAIYDRGASTANQNALVTIQNNTIGDDLAENYVRVNGVDMTNCINVDISNNYIYNLIVTHTVALRGLNLSAGLTNVNINANEIANIKNTTASSFISGQGIFIAGTGTVNASITNNTIYGLAGGLGSGTIANNQWGIIVSTGNTYRIYYNSISLTNNAVATGSTDRHGCIALNSAASTGLDIRNNNLSVTMAPGNATAGNVVCINSLVTAPANFTDINYNNYYGTGTRFGVGFMTTIRTTLADWQAATTKDANSINTNPLFASSTSNLRVGSTSLCLNAGTPIGTVLTDLTGAVRSVTTPTIGAYEAPLDLSDAGVTIVYTMGTLALSYTTNHIVSATIINSGNVDLGSFDATLNITGANSFTNAQNIPSLAVGASTTVTFAGFTPSSTGSNTVTVSVPADGSSGNNSIAVAQTISTNALAYSIGTVASGGVGFTGATGDFVAKFNTNIAASLNQCVVNFSTGGQTFQLGVWDATGPGGSPGTNIFTSADLISSAGAYTVVLDPVVNLTAGDFYIGVRQIGTVNVSFAYQTETPIRANSFYFTSPTGGTTWTDFSPANSFRFMIEPRFQLNNDAAVTGIGQSGSTFFNPGTTTIPMSGTVANLGATSATFDVIRKIRSGETEVYSNTQNVIALAANGSTTVNFADFTGFVTGTQYRIKDSIVYSGDQNPSNDTLSTWYTPNVAKTYLICWADAASRDSLINQMTLLGNTDYDVLQNTYTGTFRPWRTVIYLLASTGNWTALNRDSLKAYLDDSPSGSKRTLAIFGNDLGYNNDPIRNVSVTAPDSTFYRQYLRAQYYADSWYTAFPNKLQKGTGVFSAITGDSTADPFPDLLRPATWYGGDGAFVPQQQSTGSTDSAVAIAYTGSNYNVFYGSCTYANYRSKVGGTLDAPADFLQQIVDWVGNNGGLVPVEMASFTSSINEREVTLRWTTNQERNNSKFILERKLTSAANYDQIATVDGAGNSNVPVSYSFTDRNLNTARYNYRLKQVDYNGNFEYYNLANEVIIGVPQKYALSQNYPNPFNPTTKINYDLPFDSKVTIKIFDITGREMGLIVNEVKAAGYYNVQFNASHLSSGVYFYQINADGGNQNFVKTLKMMLIK